MKGFLHEVGSNQNWITMRDTKGFDSNQKCLPFLLYILYITNLIWEGGEKFNKHKKCYQYETKKFTESEIFHIFFCMCNSNYSLSHTLIKQSNQGSHYLVFSFHWLQITLTKLSKAMSGFETILQVNNYENFFHICHNMTWYSVIVHKFTRIYPVCSTYSLINMRQLQILFN